MEQTKKKSRVGRGEKRPFSSLFFQFLHNTLRFYDTPESPAGPIKQVKKKKKKAVSLGRKKSQILLMVNVGLISGPENIN